MGIKGIILACFLIIIVIFSYQNLQGVTLIFFGFYNITLPLSFAILTFVFLGLISSFLIKFLGYFSKSKSSNKRDKEQYNPPPPPSKPSINNSEYSYTRENELTEENFKEKIKPSQAKINQEQTYQEQIYQDLEEEEISPIINQNKTVIQSESFVNNQQNYDTPSIAKDREEIDIVNIEDKPNNNPVDVEEKDFNNIEQNFNYSEETSEELVIKTRLASPYSYKTREKTEIIPSNYQKKYSKKKPVLSNDDNVYTASYRVITPANDEYPTDYLSDDDRDDDWDF